MIFEHEDYRRYLKDVLVKRQKRRPAYSLRALARDLGVQPSLLSEVLSGKREFSETTLHSVSERLELDADESDYFRLLVHFKKAKTDAQREKIRARIERSHPRAPRTQDLDLERFRAISDWIHFALLRYLEIPRRFRKEEAARRFGLHVYEIEAAIGRLVTLGLARADAKRGFVKTAGSLRVESKRDSEALKRYHEPLFAKASESLRRFSPSERYTGTETVLLRTVDLPAAAEIIEECFTRLLALSARSSAADSEVYHFAMNGFPLSREAQSKGKQS